jgi:hypothetical protein
MDGTGHGKEKDGERVCPRYYSKQNTNRERFFTQREKDRVHYQKNIQHIYSQTNNA